MGWVKEFIEDNKYIYGSATAKEIKDAVEMAKKHDIRVVFVSPQSTTKSAEVIAGEIY